MIIFRWFSIQISSFFKILHHYVPMIQLSLVQKKTLHFLPKWFKCSKLWLGTRWLVWLGETIPQCVVIVGLPNIRGTTCSHFGMPHIGKIWKNCGDFWTLSPLLGAGLKCVPKTIVAMTMKYYINCKSTNIIQFWFEKTIFFNLKTVDLNNNLMMSNSPAPMTDLHYANANLFSTCSCKITRIFIIQTWFKCSKLFL